MTQLFFTLFLASRAGRGDGAAVNRHQPNDTMKTITATGTTRTCKLANGTTGIECLVTYSDGTKEIRQFESYTDLAAAR
jgi:hypothetical protein